MVIRLVVLALVWGSTLFAAVQGRHFEAELRAAIDLRRALLIDPATAVQDFCTRGQVDEAPHGLARSCERRLAWQVGEAFQAICREARAPPSSDPRFRPGRYYLLETRCHFGLGSGSQTLPLLRTLLFR